MAVSVYKRYNGKKVTSTDPNYDKATWYCWVRVRGQVIHQKLAVRTKAQAEKEEKVLIDRAINGALGDWGFSDFVDERYSKYIEGLASKETQEYHIQVLKDFFKNKKLAEIKTQDCRDFRNTRVSTETIRKEPRSNASVNREMAALSKIFALAIEEGSLSKNPTAGIKKLTEDKPRHRILTDIQLAALWTELDKDPYVKDFVILAINLPLRRGQLLAIKDTDVDLTNRVLTAVGSKRKPARKMYINDDALPVLQKLVSTRTGDLFPIKRFEKRWQKILTAAGINSGEKGKRKENYHIHDLRTHFGTSMILKGIHPRVVQGVFDHSDMKTSSIYMATDFEMQKRALEALSTKKAATNPATNSKEESPKTQ